MEDTTLSRLRGITYGSCWIMTVGSYGAFDNVKCDDIQSVYTPCHVAHRSFPPFRA